MAIHRLLQGAVFDDRAVKAMTTAYDAALVDLGLLNRTERLKEIIACKIRNVRGTVSVIPNVCVSWL